MSNTGRGGRRDLTPTGFRVSQEEPQTIELTINELSSLARDSAAALRKGEENAEKLAELTKKVDALLETRTKGNLLAKIFMWGFPILFPLLAGFVGWVYSEQRAHDVRLTRTETVLIAQNEALQRAERLNNMSAQDRSNMRADIRAMRAMLDELRRNVADIRTDVREIRGRR